MKNFDNFPSNRREDIRDFGTNKINFPNLTLDSFGQQMFFVVLANTLFARQYFWPETVFTSPFQVQAVCLFVFV